MKIMIDEVVNFQQTAYPHLIYIYIYRTILLTTIITRLAL